MCPKNAKNSGDAVGLSFLLPSFGHFYRHIWEFFEDADSKNEVKFSKFNMADEITEKIGRFRENIRKLDTWISDFSILQNFPLKTLEKPLFIRYFATAIFWRQIRNQKRQKSMFTEFHEFWSFSNLAVWLKEFGS